MGCRSRLCRDRSYRRVVLGSAWPMASWTFCKGTPLSSSSVALVISPGSGVLPGQRAFPVSRHVRHVRHAVSDGARVARQSLRSAGCGSGCVVRVALPGARHRLVSLITRRRLSRAAVRSSSSCSTRRWAVSASVVRASRSARNCRFADSSAATRVMSSARSGSSISAPSCSRSRPRSLSCSVRSRWISCSGDGEVGAQAGGCERLPGRCGCDRGGWVAVRRLGGAGRRRGVRGCRRRRAARWTRRRRWRRRRR